MADEEVDWGMEDSVDVWRQGESVAAGDNDDEISLGGMEGESDATKPTNARSGNSPRTSMSRAPPTGPRRPSRRGEDPNSAGTTPAGPKRGQRANGRGGNRGAPVPAVSNQAQVNGVSEKKTVAQETAPIAETVTVTPSTSQPVVPNPADSTANSEPLPEGWTEVFSRTQKAVFYHNKLTAETSWVRPRVAPVEVEEDRPVTPPPAAPATLPIASISKPQSIGTPVPAQSAEHSVPSAPASMPGAGKPPISAKAPPTGPGGGDKKAGTPIDPVQSAYAGRRTVKASRNSRPASMQAAKLPTGPLPASVPARPDDRGLKRSPSPRRAESKRTKMDDPSRITAADRSTLPQPPAGPRSFSHETRAPRSPGRLNVDDRYRPEPRANTRADDRPPQKPSQPARPMVIARGSNSAPLTNSKWGSRPDLEAAASTPIVITDTRDATRLPYAGREMLAPAASRTTGMAEDASARRARLREEARKAEETLKQIRDEELRLEREEDAERRSRQGDVDRKRRDEDRLREDDERRRRDDEWRRDDEHRRAGDDRERRVYSPERLRHDDRSYRPVSPAPPPRGPPPSNRLDGPGQPVGLRDARRARPDSPSRISRRTSPVPFAPSRPRSRSPQRPSSRYANRAQSPPRRNGDSYYPDSERVGERERRGPTVPLADRIGRAAARQPERQPEISAESMRARPRSPPPIGRTDSFRRGEAQAAAGGSRPLAERMSRSDAKESSDGRNVRNVIARRM